MAKTSKAPIAYNEIQRRVDHLYSSPVVAFASSGPEQHGAVYAANESRFNQAYYNEPVTNYLVGWNDESNLEETLELIAPSFDVPHRFSYKEAINAEAFRRVSNIVRAIGADFPSVERTGKETLGRLYNKGLSMIVDLDEIADPNNYVEEAATYLRNIILRAEILQAVGLLDAAATSTGAVFASTTNPDGLVRGALRTAKLTSGVRPNRVVYGAGAWDLRIAAYEAQTSAGAAAALARDESRLASYLGVKKVGVSDEVYQSSASAKTELVPQSVYIYSAVSGGHKDDPSNIKRFRGVCPAHPGVPGGGYWRVYNRSISTKLHEVVVECYSDIRITSLLGIHELAVTES